MVKIMYKLILFLLLLNNLVCSYEIPKPDFKVYKNGFKCTIPIDENVKAFAFHGNLNKVIKGGENGEFSGEVVTTGNEDTISYYNTNLILKVGDEIYYWIFVQYDRLGYRLQNQKHIVKEIINLDQTTVRPIKVTKPTLLPPLDIRNSDCIQSITTVNGRPQCRDQLIFEEQFNNIEINTTKWLIENKLSLDVEDAEFTSYESNPETIYIENNYLTITPKLRSDKVNYIRSGVLDFLSNCTFYSTDEEMTYNACKRDTSIFSVLPPVISSKLNSRKSFSFKYGKVDIRAKLPKGDWVFPILELEPKDYLYGRYYFQSGIIRIAFIRGNEFLKDGNKDIDGRVLFGGAIILNETDKKYEYLKMHSHSTHLGDDFHIYSLIWTKEKLTLFVDNEQYGEVNLNFNSLLKKPSVWTGPNAPFDQEFTVSIGVGVGGMGDFPDKCVTGTSGLIKPWINRDPRAELNFYMDRNNWLKTWLMRDTSSTRLEVDYIKIWTL